MPPLRDTIVPGTTIASRPGEGTVPHLVTSEAQLDAIYGEPAGFVRVVDSHTVMLPDRRGNNRIDSLRNIVRDPRVALLFLIPGVGRTLRINGRAAISIDPEL